MVSEAEHDSESKLCVNLCVEYESTLFKHTALQQCNQISLL